MSETLTAAAVYPDLAGKTALITGVGRSWGIGAGIAGVLAAQGMKLFITAQEGENVGEIAARLTEAGATCFSHEADLTTPAGAETVFAAAIERLGRVDLLVNNAAAKWSQPIHNLDEEAYRISVEGNLRIVYGITHLVCRRMSEGDGGNIIHISSVGGIRAHRGAAGYNAVKGAVHALTRSMAVDLAPRKVRVNCIAPGATMAAPQQHWDKYPERKAELESRIPLGRMGTPTDIGNAVAFLASDAASYITGQVLPVDGGIVAQLAPPGIRL